MVVDDTGIQLIVGRLDDINSQLSGVRSDLHSFIASANETDAKQGVSIADLQARMSNVEQDVMYIGEDLRNATTDRSALWNKVWQFGITGAIVAQIVLGSKFESVVR